MTTFTELLAQHVGTAFARQLAFGDFLGDRNWAVNIWQGICQFGDDLMYSLQLLGTEATGDSTWLWAWANEASNLPPELLLSSGNKLFGNRNRDRIGLTFDDRDRLINIEAKLSPKTSD